MGKNPLDTEQREKVGPATFSKFEYQYHYALCRCIDLHAELNEYLVFVEFHEDVVFGNALDSRSCKFEFCQVKNKKSPKFNQNNLTKCSATKMSVLGKLLSSTEIKPYSGLIQKINLAASCGFSLKLKLEGEQYSDICVTELADCCSAFLLDAMTKEIKISKLPTQLHFTTPELQNPGYRETAISKITEFMEATYPNNFFKPKNVYTALIDDLHRKGTITHDFQNWDDFVKRKSLTSKTIAEIIELNTLHHSEAGLQHKLQMVCNELEISTLEKIALMKDAEQVQVNRAINVDIRSARIHDEVATYIGATKLPTEHTLAEVIDDISTSVIKKNDKLEIEASELLPIILYYLAK